MEFEKITDQSKKSEQTKKAFQFLERLFITSSGNRTNLEPFFGRFGTVKHIKRELCLMFDKLKSHPS